MFGSPTSNEVDKTNTGTGVTGSNPSNSPSTTANGVTANGQTIDTLDGNNGNAVSPGTNREFLTKHDALGPSKLVLTSIIKTLGLPKVGDAYA